MAFITSLRIKNFFSIKDEVTIDFKASPYNIENNPERLFEFNGKYYNKVISFYGANASGKTTVLKAIVSLSNIIVNQDDKVFFKSFKNKFSTSNENTRIAITFALKIDKEFQEFLYEVELESSSFENIGIKNEKLFQLINNKEIVLIDRNNEIVKNIDKNVKKVVFENLKNKKSLIQEVYKFENTKRVKAIADFFLDTVVASNIATYNTDLGIASFIYKDMAIWLTEFSKNNELEKFYLSFFHSIGLDISKIETKYEESDIKAKELKNIDIFHNIDSVEALEIGLESDGT